MFQPSRTAQFDIPKLSPTEKDKVLERIDNQYPCWFIIRETLDGFEYCDNPEWDPFSCLCSIHDPRISWYC